MRKALIAWFSYTKAERAGIIILSLILIGVITYRMLLPNWQHPVAVNVDPTTFQNEIAVFEKDTILDLNTATPEQLDRLKGIGPVLAQRIVDFREEVGGFVNKEQVNDVKGIGDAKYAAIAPYIRVDKVKVTKLHLNSATEDQLLRHPYMTKSLVKAILKRRDKKGPFESWDDVKDLKQMNDDRYKELRPYLDLR